MPLAEIRGGAHVEIPNLAEIGAELDARLGPESRATWWDEQASIASQRQREQLRAIKDMRRSTLVTTPAGTRVTILDGITPEAGYKWVIRYIGVYLAAAGTGQAFITSDTTSTLGELTKSKPVAVFTTSAQWQTQSIPEGACILSVDEGLYLNFTQNVTGYMLAGWESPAELVGRLA
jgi:hypothetical protein